MPNTNSNPLPAVSALTPDAHQLPVLRLGTSKNPELEALLHRYGLALEIVSSSTAIDGSYWGEDEAGLVGNKVLASPATPVHSILHEACHFVCMDKARREALHTDAGGGYDEENGVCYLQILLADNVSGMSRERMFRDMDAWGYSFRLGSAKAWFEQDADDALEWLITYGIVDNKSRPSWLKR